MHATEVVRLVESAVDEHTARGEMFTAFDISQEVQAKGVPYRHRNLKEIVHALFEQGRMPQDYTRTARDVGGRGGPAWVYHRDCDDPAWYGRQRDFDNLFDEAS